MFREMHKSKLHRATITDANLHYAGSLTIDEELMEMVDLLVNEKVQVVNINTGARLETYVIKGERGKREICLNGAAARLGEVGDRIIIISYALMDDTEARQHQPKVVVLDEHNQPVGSV
ncbi:MAG: aspartate 1-decarboxylase [Gemmatimonadetes bacterium]|nr:MAG: aspartate 1-decarboxylase [Gemmatimonadota bacterium]